MKRKVLQKGSKIGLVSPSRELPSEYVKLLNSAISNFSQEFDVEFVLGENALKTKSYMAGTPKERVSDLHSFVDRDDIDGIFFTIGGGSANQMLDLIDWNLIKKNPKVYTGISDATCLLLPISLITNQITYYGMEFLKIYGYGIDQKYEKPNIEAVLFGIGDINKTFQNNPNRQFIWGDTENKDIKNENWEVFKEGKSKGNLYGGVLSGLTSNFGSRYFPDIRDKILLIEVFSGDSNRIHQQLEGLKLRGLFDNCNGLILGLHIEHLQLEKTDRQRDLKEIYLDVLAEYGFPIIYIPDVGHSIRSLIFPIGANVEIDTSHENLFNINL